MLKSCNWICGIFRFFYIRYSFSLVLFNIYVNRRVINQKSSGLTAFIDLFFITESWNGRKRYIVKSPLDLSYLSSLWARKAVRYMCVCMYFPRDIFMQKWRNMNIYFILFFLHTKSIYSRPLYTLLHTLPISLNTLSWGLFNIPNSYLCLPNIPPYHDLLNLLLVMMSIWYQLFTILSHVYMALCTSKDMCILKFDGYWLPETLGNINSHQQSSLT